MQMDFSKLAWVLVMIALNLLRPIRAVYFEQCDGMDAGDFVASTDDCRAYIYCDGDDSLMGYCEEGQYFDGEAVTCDLAENVYCALDYPDGPEESEEPEESAESTSTTSTTTTTTTTTMTATTSSDQTTAEPALTVPPLVRDSCPLNDDTTQIVLVPNRESCADYFMCYHGHAIEMHCTDHLHFNTYTGKCDFPERVQCQLDRPTANKCLPHITDFFPHPEKCNYFYYCIKGFMTVQQCPFRYGWDIERRSCVEISQAKCFQSYNRTFIA